MPPQEREKRRLFGMDEEELADALEAIYKRQKNLELKLDEVLTHVVSLRTTVHTAPSVAADPGVAVAADDGDGDGVPPLVKWALSQPWGVDLMHGLTDQQMIQGLVRTGFEWLRNKTAAAQAAKAAGGYPPPGYPPPGYPPPGTGGVPPEGTP